MNILQAIILGLVEGITEYLPVSSTGHLIIAGALLGLDEPASKRAIDDFMIVIQGGAILAVLGLYWPRVLSMLRGVMGKNPAGLRMAINIVVAFVPAAVLGLWLDDLIEEHLFKPAPVLAALFLGGVWMIGIDRWRRRKQQAAVSAGMPADQQVGIALEDMTWKHALAIGCFQCVAMWPGTSRSMMTIAGGMMVGLRPRDAAEFSFLLGLPTLGAACLYKLAKNLKHAHDTGTPNLFEQLGVTPVIVGIAVATVSAVLAVRWLVGFLNRHGLAAFGWYRIALTLVLGVLMWQGIVSIG